MEGVNPLDPAVASGGSGGAPGGNAPSPTPFDWDPHHLTTTLSGGGVVPRHLGQFQVRRVISSGPLGTIYEALQDHPRRLVALKLARPATHTPADGVVRRRFEDEAQILAALRHPAIAQVYEAGTLRVEGPAGVPEDVPYIAMEHVQGTRTLLDHAQAKGLTARQRLGLFAEVCDGVDQGHRQGVVHRDIRTGNVMADGDGRPRIADFGLTRALDQDSAPDAPPPEVEEQVESLAYRSPERLRAPAAELDTRGDVYALGVMLYELLSDHIPFDLEALPPEGTARALARMEPRRLSEWDSSLRGDTETIVLKAMHRDPRRRYTTAGELARDVRRFLDGQPIAARRDSPLYVTRTVLRASAARHPLVAALFAVGVGWVAAWPGTPLVFSWALWNGRPLGAWFERAAAVLAPKPRASTLDTVRVIGVMPDTNLEELAAREGISGVDNASLKTARALHGRLMTVLADSKASVVVWDMYFPHYPNEELGDPEFRTGVESLLNAGIPVVIAITPWVLGPEQELPIAPVIHASGVSTGNGTMELRHGGLTIDDEEGNASWKHTTVVWRPGHEPMASFALEALAASRRPREEAVYEVDEDAGQVEIRYRAGRGGGGRTHEVARERVTIGSVGWVSSRPPRGYVTGGLQPGDGCGVLVLTMPDNATLNAATIAYERVFDATPEQLKEWFGGKAVVIGGLRDRAPWGDYPRPLPDGRDVYPVYAHAVALDVLRSGPVIHLPRPWQVQVLILGGALLGAAIPWLVRAGPVRWSVVVLTGVLLITISLLAFSYAQYLCNPLVPVLSLLVAAAVAGRAVRARESRA